MAEIFDQIQRIGETDATVLLRGESGTGKELVAAALHRKGPRAVGPYSAVNMAAVPDTLIESELFGHVRGAFTGAACDRAGRFEAANGGTLFIDEIGDLKLTSQAKLLRVLEEQQITPVGGMKSFAVDVRVVAATNKDLEKMVTRGDFREDLYYRLNVVTLCLPPLRERIEDIPLLTDHFLRELCRKYDAPTPAFSDELKDFFLNYEWPGNIRQLRNCIESMVILGNSTCLTMDDLPDIVRDAPVAGNGRIEIPSDVTLAELERVAILQSLERSHGNRTRAAQSLDISVRTLQRKLKRWGITAEDNDFTWNRVDRGSPPVGIC
jgi:DNA-binding NtrC family response regulator